MEFVVYLFILRALLCSFLFLVERTVLLNTVSPNNRLPVLIDLPTNDFNANGSVIKFGTSYSITHTFLRTNVCASEDACTSIITPKATMKLVQALVSCIFMYAPLCCYVFTNFYEYLCHFAFLILGNHLV